MSSYQFLPQSNGLPFLALAIISRRSLRCPSFLNFLSASSDATAASREPPSEEDANAADGAVHQALGTIDEYEGNAVGMLWNWWRYLDNKKDSDIMSSVITRKVQKLKAQAIGTAQYESPDAFLYE